MIEKLFELHKHGEPMAEWSGNFTGYIGTCGSSEEYAIVALHRNDRIYGENDIQMGLVPLSLKNISMNEFCREYGLVSWRMYSGNIKNIRIETKCPMKR